MTVRLRFALLYSGAFLLTGLLVLSLAFFAASATKQVGTSGPVVIRHPLAQIFGPTADTVASLVLVLAVLVVLSVAFGWLLANRLLRPLRMITAAAQDISVSNLSRRLRLGRRDDEFTTLGRTLNDRGAGHRAAGAVRPRRPRRARRPGPRSTGRGP
jgi:methyl-accepting chemotaxis protein